MRWRRPRPMDDADGADAAAAPAAKQKRGVSGLPRGVSKTKAPGRWQACVTVKVNGASKQRSAGSYASVEEAAQTVIEYEAVLAAGGDPWTEPARVNKHKRGEVCLPERVALTAVCSLTRCACSAQAPRNEDGSRFCERKTDRRWKKNKGASTAAEEAENQAENERDACSPCLGGGPSLRCCQRRRSGQRRRACRHSRRCQRPARRS